jgi:chemotaxis signal transduction protein
MNYYLKFIINNINFAAPINEVKEVARPRSIMRPATKGKNLVGLFELRREKLPLYDLPRFLDLQSQDPFEVIISVVQRKLIGFKVDEVYGIVTSQELTPFPELAYSKKYFEGVIKEGNSFIQVLSFKKIVSGPRLRSIVKYSSS